MEEEEEEEEKEGIIIIIIIIHPSILGCVLYIAIFCLFVCFSLW
jgi:flagellar basal body-associated protein FliL